MDQATRDRLNAGASANCYDRRGYPMPLATWAECFEDLHYKRVAVTWLPGKRKWVSTVWLGLDHRCLGDGPPLIFESMVFSADGPWIEPGVIFRTRYKSTPDLAMRRYSTEAEALAGHHELVRWWRLNRRRRRALESSVRARRAVACAPAE